MLLHTELLHIAMGRIAVVFQVVPGQLIVRVVDVDFKCFVDRLLAVYPHTMSKRASIMTHFDNGVSLYECNAWSSLTDSGGWYIDACWFDQCGFEEWERLMRNFARKAARHGCQENTDEAMAIFYSLATH